LIFSAIAAGQIVARVGRYKYLMFGSLLLLGLSLFLMTNLRTETDRPVLWLWMLLAGLGVGPSFAVFTLIVQNAVSPDRIGAATGSLTFFQQIGGTVGLTIAGTLFADRIRTEIPAQLIAHGVPQPIVDQFASGGAAAQLDLTGTGDLGATILKGTPDAFKPIIEPLIPNIVAGIHEAISISIATTFWAGIVAAVTAAILVLFLHEVPMRTTMEGGATLRENEGEAQAMRAPESAGASG
jgi:hypothetical protein